MRDLTVNDVKIGSVRSLQTINEKALWCFCASHEADASIELLFDLPI